MNTNQTNQANTTKNSDWAKRDIGALWKKEGKSGKYLSGYFKDELGEQVEIVVFSNKFKGENAKAPDFRVYLSKDSNSTSASPKATEVEQPIKVKVQKPQAKQVQEVEEDLL
jgi:uncharacterized protein (DUF736 family)